ncbi:hypothetical protein FPRO06_08442 [Fusarium proliferatum]|uniref:C2H2 type master regulator of conidiophore development brlA n=1 Tax=Gibberella intermedia TaxID=948311 RepID=A0A365NCL5_GIBIN|nr:hypothetical protein FPRO06_08442 [Fusarium proliferatum]RBA18550.1 hypothetical protein FPRO05_10198 [Fusarium proliferatum]
MSGMRSPAPTEVMDITNMLNKKGQMQQLTSGLLDHQQYQHAFVKHEPGMERSASPHGSEHSQYSNPHSIARAYPSPSTMQAPMHMPNPMSAAMTMQGYPEMPNMGGMPHMHMQQMPQQPPPPPQQPIKAYPCSTCGKGFARRSDLARHGNDSSSLARHRRTHSGKRPYKCPYADCQKTFTRRTTLTRHQNHHSGTIEEAAAATAAALAASKSKGLSQARSESDHMSNHGSPLTTPSPSQRTMSMSPSVDLSGNNSIPRHPGDFQYLSQNGSLPMHMRVGSPTSTSSGGFNMMRPTSHPTSYGPPPTLEPNLDNSQGTPSSNGGSPHMANVGWQSPSHMASPSQNNASYVYPDPADAYPANQAMNQMYYSAATHMRRPQSTEPGLVHMA